MLYEISAAKLLIETQLWN